MNEVQKFNDYQTITGSLAIYKESTIEISTDPKIQFLLNMSYLGMGLGEAGEVQNKLKKIIRDCKGYPTEEKKEQIKGELAGNLWYISELAALFGWKLSDIATYSANTLLSRKQRGVLKGDGDNR